MKISRSLFAIIATFLIAALPIAAPAQFSIGVGFTIGTPPPPLPYFAQPPAPYPNYMWTPGYWAWGPAGYFWVPGTWVAPPSVGMYWTPGFWGATAGGYGWNAGYWGPTVGFYGGINYGFGFPGTGFYGGGWNNGAFAYNTAVTNVNRTTINNTYNKTVINKNNVCNNCKNVSFNGGHGGTTVRPSQAQITSRKTGIAPTSSQKNQATIAGQDRNQLYSVNKGKPAVATSDRAFSNDNKPKNFAPVTTADKQAGSKIPTRGDNSAANNQFAAANKAAVNNKPLPTQNKPATTTQNKPAATTQNKPAATTQNKPAATTQHKPATTTQHQPATTSQHPGSNSKMGAATRPAGQQNTHLRNNPARPNQAPVPNQMTRPNRHQQMQNQAMHQGQSAHQGGQNRPQGQGGQNRPQGHPTSGNGGGRPPHARGHSGHRR